MHLIRMFLSQVGLVCWFTKGHNLVSPLPPSAPHYITCKVSKPLIHSSNVYLKSLYPYSLFFANLSSSVTKSLLGNFFSFYRLSVFFLLTPLAHHPQPLPLQIPQVSFTLQQEEIPSIACTAETTVVGFTSWITIS